MKIFGHYRRTIRANYARDLSNQTLVGRVFKYDMGRTNFSGSRLLRAQFVGAEARRSNFTGASMAWTNCFRAKFDFCDFTEVDFSWANLKEASLVGVDLTRAILDRADLTQANLSRSNLKGADLSRATLAGATLTGCTYDETTKWPAGMVPQDSEMKGTWVVPAGRGWRKGNSTPELDANSYSMGLSTISDCVKYIKNRMKDAKENVSDFQRFRKTLIPSTREGMLIWSPRDSIQDLRKWIQHSFGVEPESRMDYVVYDVEWALPRLYIEPKISTSLVGDLWSSLKSFRKAQDHLSALPSEALKVAHTWRDNSAGMRRVLKDALVRYNAVVSALEEFQGKLENIEEIVRTHPKPWDKP